ncbi:MAG: glycosyltransferase, partial [Aureliella sp.]
LTVKYMLDYYSSPMKLFGRIGLGFLALGTLMLGASVAGKLLMQIDMTGNPLLLLGAILCVVSIQLFSLGLLGEANTRLYYARNSRRPFTIRKTICHSAGDAPATLPMRRSA